MVFESIKEQQSFGLDSFAAFLGKFTEDSLTISVQVLIPKAMTIYLRLNRYLLALQSSMRSVPGYLLFLGLRHR